MVDNVKTKDKLKTAEVLAFERKLANSDALMYAGRWGERESSDAWPSINVQEKSVRGTISNRFKAEKANDPAKLNAEIQKANLQKIDVAALPFDCNTLKVSFTLRVLGNLVTPCACNNPMYQNALVETLQGYIQEYKFKELATRYAENIANGRFLWRNRIGAEAIEVKVKCHNKNQKNTWIFNAIDFDLRQFSANTTDQLSKFTQVIQEGLLGDTSTFLEIDAFVHLGAGQEIFPSQELVLDNSSSKKGKKSKFLYQVKEVAAMHSQKIGNAIRTIDTWYPGANELGPIAVEPYGSVTNRGVAYRQPKDKKDFYTLLDSWILKNQAPEVEQQHYVMACLIRGGVFGATSKEK
jgi:CRISPR-associated protein Csy3